VSSNVLNGASSKTSVRAGLIRLLEDWSLPDADVVAILNPKSIRTARVDAFLSHLAIVARDLCDER